MNDDENFVRKYYSPFLSPENHEDVSSGSERVHHQKNMFWGSS